MIADLTATGKRTHATMSRRYA